jgi:hypothetical protein
VFRYPFLELILALFASEDSTSLFFWQLNKQLEPSNLLSVVAYSISGSIPRPRTPQCPSLFHFVICILLSHLPIPTFVFRCLRLTAALKSLPICSLASERISWYSRGLLSSYLTTLSNSLTVWIVVSLRNIYWSVAIRRCPIYSCIKPPFRGPWFCSSSLLARVQSNVSWHKLSIPDPGPSREPPPIPPVPTYHPSPLLTSLWSNAISLLLTEITVELWALWISYDTKSGGYSALSSLVKLFG